MADNGQEAAEGERCPVRCLWPSWCWAGLLFLATDSKQGNFVCCDVALDEGYIQGVLCDAMAPVCGPPGGFFDVRCGGKWK